MLIFAALYSAAIIARDSHYDFNKHLYIGLSVLRPSLLTAITMGNSWVAVSHNTR